MFRGRERMAMVVKRWSTTPAINRQDIAQHSFFVALYTDHLCLLLGWPEARKYRAIHWALIHDMPETVTSDVPGPVKRIITNKEALEHVEDKLFFEFGPAYTYDRTDWQVRDVVKAANLIDEVFYLHTERLLGNQYLDSVAANSWNRLRKALDKLALFSSVSIILLNEMENMKKGVVGLINDDDLNG